LYNNEKLGNSLEIKREETIMFFHMQIILILAGGVFKKSSLFFRALTIFLESFGIIVVPVDFPQKSGRDEQLHPRLGKVGVRGYVKEVLKVFHKWHKEYPDAIFILGGHSMGALIVQKAAEKLRNKIHGLILMSPVPSKEIKLFSIWGLISFSSVLWSIIRKKPAWRPFWATNKALFNTGADEEYRRNAYGESVLEDGTALGDIIFPWRKISIDTRKIRVPVLIICGNEDRLIYPPEEIVKKMAHSYYRGRYEIVRGAAHDLFWGAPGQKAIRIIYEWIVWLANVYKRNMH
jgi:pimeloyl-ACP methyl ester carboxylesterase